MSDKLGFTFYPKDWWTSDSYFELTAIQRYYYLECLFIMYSNDGIMKTQKTQFENRTRTQVLDDDWNCVVSRFELIEGNYTHISVNKRLRKAVANRENGKKGGRPKKEDEKPKKPNLETQNNPPLESESETELESKKEKEDKNNIYLKELLNSEIWLEQTAMSTDQKFTATEIVFFLKSFNTDINLKFDYKANKSDYTTHFINWLKFKPKNNQSGPTKKRVIS